MAKFDLERFPTSPAAKRMLSYVTKGWYDNSYVGKWLYQVMGAEIDRYEAVIEELPYQFFPETATWGLRYWEMTYGLPVNENLSYEERRKLIIEKRDTKAPMNPWRMEQILSQTVGSKVDIRDINDGGDVSHPNQFIVGVQGDADVDVGDMLKKLHELKESHTSYQASIVDDVYLVITPEIARNKVYYRPSGTYPNISRRADINSADVNVIPSVASYDVLYPPATSDRHAGTFPKVSTGGQLIRGDVEVSPQNDAVYVKYQEASQDALTGMSPKTSTSGKITGDDGPISVQSKTYSVVYPLCGEGWKL